MVAADVEAFTKRGALFGRKRRRLGRLPVGDGVGAKVTPVIDRRTPQGPQLVADAGFGVGEELARASRSNQGLAVGGIAGSDVAHHRDVVGGTGAIKHQQRLLMRRSVGCKPDAGRRVGFHRREPEQP